MAPDVESISDDSFRRITTENRRLTAEVRRRVDQLDAINSVAAMVSQSLDLQETLNSALNAVMRVINVEATGISMVDHRADELVLRAQRGWRRDFVEMGMRMKLGEGLSGLVMEKDEIIVTGDISQDTRIAVPAFAEEGVQAMALAPMHAAGEIVGILSAMSYTPYEFSEEEIAVLRAVADQVGVALENARLYEQVVREQAQIKAIVNSSADAILAVDMDRQVVLASHMLDHWFGLKSEELIGQPLGEVKLPDGLLANIVEAMEHSHTGPTVSEIPAEDDRYLAFHVSPLVDEQQQQHGWVIVLQDITHFKALENLRSRVMRTAAHDLRNPLNVTSGALQMLESILPELSNQQAHIIELANRGVGRMNLLIDDMLQLERIEAGVDIEKVSVDVATLVRMTGEEHQIAAGQKAQTLIVTMPDSLPQVTGEPKLIQRALENLVSNAIKYTPDGGNIELRARHEDERIAIEVQDNGRGIPSDMHPRLFERFFRVTTGEEDEPGTGLGLAIVKSVAEEHGGQVWVRSEEGKGSTFGFSVSVGDN